MWRFLTTMRLHNGQGAVRLRGCLSTPTDFAPACSPAYLELRPMKRILVLALIACMSLSATGCRRGLRLWGCRGARCGNPWGAPAPYAPAPYAAAPPVCPPPMYAAPTYAQPGYSACPPVECCPQTTCECPVTPSCDCGSGVITGDQGFSTVPGEVISPIPTSPSAPTTVEGTGYTIGAALPGVIDGVPISDRIVTPSTASANSSASREG